MYISFQCTSQEIAQHVKLFCMLSTLFADGNKQFDI